MTPEEEEQVRRALGSLPAPEPMPPEVAARLDARLAQLRAEAAQDAGPAADPGRHRRRWPRLLVAAALVAVVGVGVGSVLDDVTSPGAMESTPASDAGGRQAGGQADEEVPQPMEAAPDQEPSARGLTARGAVADRMVLTAERIELDSGSLAADVEEFVELRLLRAAADDEVHSERSEQPTAGRRLGRLFEPCLLPPTGKGDQLVAVRLDGEPATLVLRAPDGGTRVAQVYSCDDPSGVLGRVEVAAR